MHARLYPHASAREPRSGSGADMFHVVSPNRVLVLPWALQRRYELGKASHVSSCEALASCGGG
jgi:hypothetical protein